MAINKATLSKKVNGVQEYIYPKTSADMVKYDTSDVETALDSIQDTLDVITPVVPGLLYAKDIGNHYIWALTDSEGYILATINSNFELETIINIYSPNINTIQETLDLITEHTSYEKDSADNFFYRILDSDDNFVGGIDNLGNLVWYGEICGPTITAIKDRLTALEKA